VSLSPAFYAVWLDATRTHSAAHWVDGDCLEDAQRRKLDVLVELARAAGSERVLDLGCGSGSLLTRLIDVHRVAAVSKLTLSPAEPAWMAIGDGRIETHNLRLEEFTPPMPFDAALCGDALHCLAPCRGALWPPPLGRRLFFESCHRWLKPGGRLALEAIVRVPSPAATWPGLSPSEPGSAPPTFSEIVDAATGLFDIERVFDASRDYEQTCRAWLSRLEHGRHAAVQAAGPDEYIRYTQWLEGCALAFRGPSTALLRIAMRRIDRPTRPSHPVALADAPSVADTGSFRGASARALRFHYDLGNDFFSLWLDEGMLYTSALWEDADRDDDLATAQRRKLDWFVARTGAAAAARVLDLGCGWGALAQRLVTVHGADHVVALTLSRAQVDWIARARNPRIEVRCENWYDHQPDRAYDAILAIGVVESAARPRLTHRERVGAYRDFFSRCHRWLRPGAYLGVQTSALASAQPGEFSPFIEQHIFPESEFPTLGELAEASGPFFELVELRNDREHYERTCKVWLRRLRQRRREAADLVGTETLRRYEKYLAIAAIGFHTGRQDLLRMIFRRIDVPAAESHPPGLR